MPNYKTLLTVALLSGVATYPALAEKQIYDLDEGSVIATHPDEDDTPYDIEDSDGKIIGLDDEDSVTILSDDDIEEIEEDLDDSDQDTIISPTAEDRSPAQDTIDQDAVETQSNQVEQGSP